MKEIYEPRGTEISHRNKHEFNPNMPLLGSIMSRFLDHDTGIRYFQT